MHALGLNDYYYSHPIGKHFVNNVLFGMVLRSARQDDKRNRGFKARHEKRVSKEKFVEIIQLLSKSCQNTSQ